MRRSEGLIRNRLFEYNYSAYTILKKTVLITNNIWASLNNYLKRSTIGIYENGFLLCFLSTFCSAEII